MSFSIFYKKYDEDEDLYQTIIKIEDFEVETMPQSLSDIYRDIYYNYISVRDRSLKRFFWGDEPIANVIFDKCGKIIFFFYSPEKNLNSYKSSYNEVLTCLRSSLFAMRLAVDKSALSWSEIEAEIDKDIKID